jgi:23S rRNA pseudouridine1911/1915/1917 synthase
VSSSEIRETLVVEESEHGQRLDKWLAEQLQEADYDVSRSQVQTYVKDGQVTGPRNKVKSSDEVTAGEEYVVHVPAQKPLELLGYPMDLAVVYEDDDVIVIDKPRGLVVHPAAGHERDTVVNGLIGRGTTLSTLGGDMRPGVVHRIDKDTSGLIMFAKSDLAYHGLAEQLRDHTADRQYEAIVHGVIPHDSGTIDAPVGRDPKNRQRMAVTGSGKHALTHFTILERFTSYTYLSLQLETGRTHQIRVHMAYIGHPLAGDPVYGPRHTLPIDGQALHAKVLGFVHPRDGRRLLFESPLPADFQRLLKGLTSGTW